ncbi:hypothetical protein [Nautilia lithotrophica]
MKIVIFILTAVITAILFVTYDKISQPDIERIQPTEQNITKIKTEGDVLNLSFNSFTFPARELFMKIDFKEYKNIILYKVVINANDEYAIFNIKAILENEGIAYSMLEKKKTEIFILFKSLQQAEKIIKLFKSYNFKIKIEKIIKRI